MKSIIVYSRDLKAQNLYPRRIISPPAPNKCCPARMEVLGRPRLDEQGRRFCYKRCKVCGFALRHFLDSVGTVITPATPDLRGRKPPPIKGRPPVLPGHPPALPPPAAGAGAGPTRAPLSRPGLAPGRGSAPSRHVPRVARKTRPHGGETRPKSPARRRR